jgi:uncharacterized protein YdaU (DUF1376 family)
MSAKPWMPFYPGDFVSDTTHLSTDEVGAYVLLICHYWTNGGLPKDAERLARIARMTPEQWECKSSVISAFFRSGWTHKRIDAERAKSDVISAKRSAAAHKLWGDKTNRDHASALRKHRHKQSKSNDSHNHNHITSYDLTSVGGDERPKAQREAPIGRLSEAALQTLGMGRAGK